MAEYIERNAVLSALWKASAEYNKFFPVIMLDVIKTIPAADVRPVVRGEWRHITDDLWEGGGATECSACGFGFADGAFFEVSDFRYCPNCGADMREDGKDG